MAQKTILSFFKHSTTPTPATNSKPSSSDNIVKKSGIKDVNGKIATVKEATADTDIKKEPSKFSTKKSSPKSASKKKSPSTRKKSTGGISKNSTKSEAINGSNTNGNSKVSIKEDNQEQLKNSECNNDSPIKQPKKRKRAQIVESDDDSEDEKLANQNGTSDEKMDVDDCNKTDQDDSKSESADETEVKNSSSSTTSIESTSSKGKSKRITRSPKQNGKISNGSTKKLKLDNADVENDSENQVSCQSTSSPSQTPSTKANSSCEFIPKRKTARKQMRGGQQRNELSKKAVEDSSPSATNDVVPESASNDNDSTLVVDEEMKKDVSENSENKTDVNAVKAESDDCNDELNDSEDKQEKDSTEMDSKKQQKEVSPKIKSIHPFFGSKKKESNSTSPKKNDNKKGSKDIKCSAATGSVYDPTKNHYHPIDDACWKSGEKVPYLALAKTLEFIEDTSARLKMIEILSNFFRSVIALTPDDLLYSVYLCLNRLAPEYEGIELGVGDMLLMKAVAQATGRTVDKIKAEVAVKGDLGLVAESSRGNQRVMFAPPKLTVSSVFTKFKEIAKMTGNAAMSKKTDKIQALFVACRDCEAKYIIRSLSGKLRIGLAEQSLLAALSRAAVLTPPNQPYPLEVIDKSSGMSENSFKEFVNAQILILKTTYCECPNFDLIIPVLLKEGIAGLPEHCQLTPGCPLKPMLAHPTNGIDEVLNRFDKNEFTCEFKYDGERAQIHMTDKADIKIFSRNQEDNTSKYPDVISRISKVLKETTKSFILDTESVAYDCEAKQILPFQVLSTRKKKDAVESDIVVQVCVMAFDLLYLNGESLVKKTLKERRDLLHSSFVELENEFMFVTYRDGDSAETMQEFLDESVKGNCEGLMVKALTVDASYEIAKRSHNWLKLKKDYLKGVGDTLDLVVIGGYHGKGKRTGSYGGFLLACYDDENEEFQSICKLGTGFTEEELDTHTKFLKEYVIKEPKSYFRFDNGLEPDVWFDPVQIWEVKCADLSISPIHKAAIGIVDPEKGISLRFPRFLKIREDKKPEDATNSSQIAAMYQNQEQVQNTKNRNIKSEEDFY